ncbi:hypothetical protein SISSUDRAFT_930018 [Sistotremastrum suecicum HHB10207 ss-3]|uniref:F-box domain-containing protein n=1 Tax=Sistotremastrum suecicum HHB10207 ss-3 TaxID=1314776 RepID=A0A166BT39_9AGAM|nr:hypothetical protein SISSUDRAFT_930018 [Sistotremastrum suecicum HHB10207 ss-3]
MEVPIDFKVIPQCPRLQELSLEELPDPQELYKVPEETLSAITSLELRNCCPFNWKLVGAINALFRNLRTLRLGAAIYDQASSKYLYKPTSIPLPNTFRTSRELANAYCKSLTHLKHLRYLSIDIFLDFENELRTAFEAHHLDTGHRGTMTRCAACRSDHDRRSRVQNEMDFAAILGVYFRHLKSLEWPTTWPGNANQIYGRSVVTIFRHGHNGDIRLQRDDGRPWHG